MRVTSAQFIREYGALADRALAEAVTITQDGRDRLVLVSATEYARLLQNDRRAFLAEELSDDEIALIEASEMAPEHAHLDEELADWRP